MARHPLNASPGLCLIRRLLSTSLILAEERICVSSVGICGHHFDQTDGRVAKLLGLAAPSLSLVLDSKQNK